MYGPANLAASSSLYFPAAVLKSIVPAINFERTESSFDLPALISSSVTGGMRSICRTIAASLPAAPFV